MTERDFETALQGRPMQGETRTTREGTPLYKVLAERMKDYATECNKAATGSGNGLHQIANALYSGKEPLKTQKANNRKHFNELRRRLIDGKEIGVYPPGSSSGSSDEHGDEYEVGRATGRGSDE